MAKATTPADLTITPRDRRFGRGARTERWWANGDPYATAFFNALSVTFPKGEAFFIEAVKAHREGVPDRLAREIRAFTLQEVMHSREHVAFNSRVVDAGYDVWIGNNRGTMYSWGHKTLDAASDPEYWDWTWGNMGLSDDTANITAIKNATGLDKIFYLGYSQGTA